MRTKTLVTRGHHPVTQYQQIFGLSIRQIAILAIALGVLIGLLFAPLSARAQVGTADVLGTVTDFSGAVVADAKVTIKNLGTSAERTTTANAEGEYIFTTLPNGTYSLTVEAKGFKAFTVANLPLSTGDRARYDAKLEIGTITENVQVSAATVPVLQTDSSTISSTIEDSEVQDLPLNNRQFVTALELQPGISAGNVGGSAESANGSVYDRRPSAAVSANGQSSALNNQMVDGFDNNERLNGLIGLQPSIDGIAEVKMDTNTYRAEYGRTAGAVINVITRSGTNGLHGSAYDYFRNDIFDASSYNFYATPSLKPEYRQNNFGGSVGGPIKKDKTFFFFDLEEDRIIRGQTFYTTVPTAWERANPGDFSDAGQPSLITMGIPLDPLMVKYFNLFPASQYDQNGLGHRTDSPNLTQYGTTWDLRIDHHFSANNLFFARYASNPVTTMVPEPWPQDPATGIYPGGSGAGLPGPSSTKSQNLQFDYVHIFTPVLLMDLKAGYTRVNIASYSWNYGKGASDKLGILNAYIPGLPQTDGLMDVGGPAFEWSPEGDAGITPILDISNTFQYSGAITYTRGTHTFKFGGGVNRRQIHEFDQSSIDGSFFFGDYPPFNYGPLDFLSGYAFAEIRGNRFIASNFRTWEAYAYAQDDWRVTRKLTLNLGLRYDDFTPFTEADGRYVNYIPSTESFIQGTQNPTIGIRDDYRNIAPRFGFAYSVTPKTVVHGAFGISFFPPDVGQVSDGGALVSTVQNGNPPYSFSYFNVGPAIFTQVLTGPVAPTPVDLATWKTNPNLSELDAKSPGFSSAYAEQFNLALQREFGANTVSVNYVGVMGHQLLRTVNGQRPDPPGAGNPTPSYNYPDLYTASCVPGGGGPPSACVSAINLYNNGSSSNYNAMQVVFARRIVKGLMLNANWTWAHDLTDVPSGSSGALVPTNPKYDYGNDPTDIRHRVSVVASYALPFAKNAHGIMGAMLKGWQATSLGYWQTGLPFTVESTAPAPNGMSYTNQPGVSTDRPDVVGKVSLHNPGLHEWFNVQAFRPQELGTVGNEAPNQFRGPRDRRVDLAITKNFSLKERFKLQFRAECFNLSNTPNFYLGNSFQEGDSNASIGLWQYQIPNDPTSPVVGVNTAGQTVGQITNTAANENPRQFQFALKLMF
jgi:hypothetical protein